jgi:hypothetical protein
MASSGRSSGLAGVSVRTAPRSIKTTRIGLAQKFCYFKSAQETRSWSASFLQSARSPPW